MRLSDIIEQMINEALEQQGGTAELQRNELANKVGCVPSQINYVVSSRYTPEQGYVVESRRGAGGYIRITKVKIGKDDFVMHIVNSVGDTLDAQTALRFVANLMDSGALTVSEAAIMQAALSDKCMQAVAPQVRDQLRADVMKSMLMSFYTYGR